MYLPGRPVTNQTLADRGLDTSDAWIRERTGIMTRHLASPEETTSFMASRAALEALRLGGVTADDLGLIIVATATPDRTFPSVAAGVQRAIGNGTCAACVDLQAACSGFVYGLATAEALMLRPHGPRRALVIGAEKMSAIVDWQDRNTCVLFGDGAGAALLVRDDAPASDSPGILGCTLHGDGHYGDILCTTGGVTTGFPGVITMEGKEVFRHAVRRMTENVRFLLESHGFTTEQLTYLTPHQANRRIMDKTAQQLDLKPSQILSYVEHHANTSAASIPLALAAAHQDGKLRTGDLLAMTAIGAGLTWGGCLARWG